MMFMRPWLTSAICSLFWMACGSNDGPHGKAAIQGTGGASADAAADAAVDSVNPGVSDRLDLNFNLDWKFSNGNSSGADTPAFDDSTWNYVDLPHTTKFVTPEDPNAYIGISWYRKHFTLSDSYRGSKVFLEFEAAMQAADVWINGIHKVAHYASDAPVSTTVTHEGGYTPFTLDLTHDVVFGGGDNTIAVKLDSQAGITWPPGRAGVDFQYQGGLYRESHLHIVNPVHITDPVYANKVASGGVFVTFSGVSSSEATVNINTNVINELAITRDVTVISELIDEAGETVGTDTQVRDIAAQSDVDFKQSLVIENPKLWHPDAPHLYTLHTTVQDGPGRVDSVTTRVGIRSISWSNSGGLTINGGRYTAYGVNMHQEMYGLGNAVSKQSIFYDVKRIKDAGMSFIRASHYPHSPAFYDACDELGVLVLAPQTGWQNFQAGTIFTNNSYQELRDMMRRDRNHPSIVAWEASLNESYFDNTWAKAAHAIVHQEYPGDQVYSAQWLLNQSDIVLGASQAGIRTSVDARPKIIDEYGDWDFGMTASTSRQKREAGDNQMLIQANNIEKGTSDNFALSWYSVGSYWDYADYAGFSDYGITTCGVVDMYRLPKFSYYFLQSQRSPDLIIEGVDSGPTVFIANHFTASSPTTVRVYSNCEQVSLYVNDMLFGTQAPDTGTSLWHPPFNFAVGTFSPGTLRADCLIGGIKMASHQRRTPLASAAIVLRPESTSLKADLSDTRLVFIDVVDANGTVVPGDSSQVSLSVSGPGNLVGPSVITMKGGMLATWVRAGRTPGSIVLTASATGLTPASVELVSTAVVGLPPAPADR